MLRTSALESRQDTRLVRNWVENGTAPERVVVSKMENGNPVMTRPVFPYPEKAVYDGTGDPNIEESFTAATVRE
jgi:hypothetical protein